MNLLAQILISRRPEKRSGIGSSLIWPSRPASTKHFGGMTRSLLKLKLTRIAVAGIALICLPPMANTANTASAQSLSAEALADRVVDNFRRIILLHETAPARASRAQTEGGRYLFYQNRLLSAQLVDLLASDEAACVTSMARIDADAQWRDADRLALGGVIVELALRLPAESACAPPARAARSTVAAIRLRLNSELTSAMSGNPSASGSSGRGNHGGATARAAWQAYVGFLRELFAAQTLTPDLSAPAAPVTDSAAPLARRGARDEWTDGGLPARTVLLTFDDGPHPVHTPRVLDILARYRIKAVFFQVGQNIGTLNAANGPGTQATNAVAGAAAANIRLPQLFERLLAEGHSVANHTHTHPLLPRLDEVSLTAEIDQTEALLSAATRGHPGRAALFRPPYGARNDLVLAEVTARGLRSVLWNIDSRDWADPVAQSVARRVIDEAVREGGGIVLFHDIHGRAPDALPTVIEELLKRGFRFARYTGGQLVVDP